MLVHVEERRLREPRYRGRQEQRQRGSIKKGNYVESFHVVVYYSFSPSSSASIFCYEAYPFIKLGFVVAFAFPLFNDVQKESERERLKGGGGLWDRGSLFTVNRDNYYTHTTGYIGLSFHPC